MAKSNYSPMMTVIVSLVLLCFAGFLIAPYMKDVIEEYFGAQGGEMVQLATSHVPTDSDLLDMQEEAEQVKREIVNMTGYW
jgi:hypothetical protein